MPTTPSLQVVFRQAYLGPIDQYRAWHDGFSFVTDLACLDALAERAQAAPELLAALHAHRRCPTPDPAQLKTDRVFGLICEK